MTSEFVSRPLEVAHVIVKRLPVGSENWALAGLAIKQTAAELFLKRLDLAADRRLRNAQPIGSRAKAASGSKLREDLQLS